jgi:dethiobiotin synthetase
VKNYFITGTGTNVGKTFVTCKLLQYFNRQGKKTVALKPIASDCKYVAQNLINDDAILLANAASVKLDYSSVNPVCLQEPVSPDIAARLQGIDLRARNIIAKTKKLTVDYDYCFIEGAGGWRVPINATEYISDVVIGLNIPVIVVVAVELGSINHALLTFQAIENDGLVIAGWVANIKNKDYSDVYIQENIESIKIHSKMPLLAIFERDKMIYNNLIIVA